MRYYFKGIEGMEFKPSRTIIISKTQYGMAYIRHPQGQIRDGKRVIFVDIKLHLTEL